MYKRKGAAEVEGRRYHNQHRRDGSGANLDEYNHVNPNCSPGLTASGHSRCATFLRHHVEDPSELVGLDQDFSASEEPRHFRRSTSAFVHKAAVVCRRSKLFSERIWYLEAHA
jgi:hypothetical protein